MDHRLLLLEPLALARLGSLHKVDAVLFYIRLHRSLPARAREEAVDRIENPILEKNIGHQICEKSSPFPSLTF